MPGDPDYLSFTIDYSDPDVVSSYDELSFWSAMFGQMLLERVPMRPNQSVLDIGYGAGFPLLELAERLGPTCTVHGIDPWAAARRRAEFKARLYHVSNIELVDGDAARMPFQNGQFDLLVSNLGVNNFTDPLAVLKECARVAKPGARLALTTNPTGHMREFYAVFEATLRERGLQARLPGLAAHIAHRLPVEALQGLLEQAGFKLRSVARQDAVLRYLDGSAFLRHHFIKQGFLDGWKALLAPAEQTGFFAALEANLNRLAAERGELALTIPMVYLEAERV